MAQRVAIGRRCTRSLVWLEDVLYGLPEQTRNLERKRKTGIVFLGLDRVHRLARHAQRLGEHGLRPALLQPQDSHGVPHVAKYLLRQARIIPLKGSKATNTNGPTDQSAKLCRSPKKANRLSPTRYVSENASR